MVWLATKMWLLLLLAFLLGVVSGWLVFWRQRDDLAYADGVRDDDLDAPRVRQDDVTPPAVASAPVLETVTPEPSRTVREYGNVTPKRKKIYEADLDDDTAVPAGLLDLPDRTPVPSKAPEPPTPAPADLDDIDTFEPAPARRPVLFSAPMRGPADDLKAIRGIGETLERSLNAKGIFYYDQIAAWTDDHVTWIERDIEFPGRVRRENWIDQAISLSARNPRETDLEVAPPEPSPPAQPTDKTVVEAPALLKPSVLAKQLEADAAAVTQTGEDETAIAVDKTVETPSDQPSDDQQPLLPPVAPQQQPMPAATIPTAAPANEPTEEVQPMTAMDRLIANKKLAKR
ncbi:MAG: hypothetical protein AAGH42_01325 [Pseudomonadota bacterium]